MKWKLVCCALLLFGVTICQSQEIGVRFGDISGGNVALDGVFSTSKFSRLHADVSFGDGVGIDLLWDFQYRPLGGEAFFYYIGVGPYSFLGSPFELGLVAEFGLEYHFAGFPIAIGGDWRPYLRIIDKTDFGWGGFGFNVRLVL
jgi:hypothetical protein